MQTIVIQLTNQKAMQLLLELEELSLIKVLKKGVNTQYKLSDKYAGKLSEKVGEQIQQYINKSRSEWNRNI